MRSSDHQTLVNDARLGESLSAQMQASSSADSRGNMKAEARAMEAYINQVTANTPIAFSQSQAAVLATFAKAL